MMKRRIAYIASLVLLMFALMPASTAFAKDTVKSIANELIAPCCWRQTVATHDSEISQEIKVEIAEMLDKGMTKQEILDVYVERYGQQILASPPKTGFHLIAAYIFPIIFVLAALAAVIFAALKWTRRKKAEDESSETEPPTHKYDERIENELKDYSA